MKNFFLNKKINAFTLIELIVVIAIIGILASVIYPSFVNYQKRSRDARRQVDIKTIVDALERYYVDNNVYPSSIFSKYGNFSDLEPYLVPKYLSKLPKDPLNKSFISLNGSQRRQGNVLYLYNYYYFSKNGWCSNSNSNVMGSTDKSYVLIYALESSSTIPTEYCKDEIVTIPPDVNGNVVSNPSTSTYTRFIFKGN